MTPVVPEGLYKKGFYTPTQAAGYMECDRTTIYRMLNDGRLKAVYKPSNKKMMVTGKSMVEYIEGVL